VGVTVFEMGLSLPWQEPVLAKAVRTVYQRSAVIFQYNPLKANPNIIQSLADRLSCPTLGSSRGPAPMQPSGVSDGSIPYARAPFSAQGEVADLEVVLCAPAEADTSLGAPLWWI